jgi:predicted  nucleic acid-binding Zn-ribbon protein
MVETDDEIMEHLLHIRSALDTTREDMCELKRPLGALENRYVSMSSQLDGINPRIERIERRLDLTDA